MPEADTQDSLSRAKVDIQLLLDGTPVEWAIDRIELLQRTFDHHTLVISCSLDVETMAGPEGFSRMGEYRSAIGKSLTLKVMGGEEYLLVGGSNVQLEWFGYVTAVSLANSASAINRIEVEAKSPTFLMDYAKQFRTYKDVKFGDVIKSRLSEAGLDASGVADLGDEVIKHLIQWSQTDWEFITNTHRTRDFWIYYDGKKLNVQKSGTRNEQSLQFEKNIGSLSIRMNMVTPNFIYHAWDGKPKQVIHTPSQIGTSYGGVTGNAFSASAQRLSKKSALIINAVPLSPTEASAIANARAGAERSALAICDVQSNVPSIKVGDTIRIERAGEAYSGKYFVKEIQHVIDAGGYHNFISAIPLEIAQPDWRDRSERPGAGDAGQVVVPALVSDINDPRNLGRVKVKYYMQGDSSSDLESYWARLGSANGGPERGFYFLPEVNDEVLVAFENGDHNRPIVVGHLWNNQDKPPDPSPQADGKTNKRVIKSRTGHFIEFDDTDGEEKISFIDKTAKNKMVINSKENTITIDADKDYVLTVKNNITLKAEKDFSLEAKNIKIKAQEKIEMESGMPGTDITTKGPMKLDSGASMDLTTKGQMKQEGAMVNINGQAQVAVKGALIMLN